MRVVLLTPYLSLERGSQEFRLSRSLVKRGHDVSIITSLRMDPRYYGFNQRSRLRPFSNVEGVKIIRCKVLFALGGHRGWPISMELPPKLISTKTDILHAYDYHQFFTLAGFWTSKLKKIPFIIDQRSYGDMPLLYESAKVYVEAFRIFKTTIGRRLLNGTNHFIISSSLARNYLISLGVPEHKISKIPLGVDTNVFRPLSSARRFYKEKLGLDGRQVVLYVGRLMQRKGVHVLIRAFKRVISTCPDVELVIVGDGPDATELKKLSETLGLKKKTLFLGFIPHGKLPPIYTISDVFVLPTLDIETFGMVIIEAMSTGVPVVATNIGGPKEIVNEKCGFLIQPNNPIQLSDKLLMILSQQKLQQELGFNGRRLAIKEYGSSVRAEQTLRVYEKVLSECN